MFLGGIFNGHTGSAMAFLLLHPRGLVLILCSKKRSKLSQQQRIDMPLTLLLYRMLVAERVFSFERQREAALYDTGSILEVEFTRKNSVWKEGSDSKCPGQVMTHE